MLVDPLSDRPVEVTGSANFSEASKKTNDENMLVIKDNRAWPAACISRAGCSSAGRPAAAAWKLYVGAIPSTSSADRWRLPNSREHKLLDGRRYWLRVLAAMRWTFPREGHDREWHVPGLCPECRCAIEGGMTM